MNSKEHEAILWTCQPTMLRKFAKWGIEPMRVDGEGKAYKIPKKWIRISRGRAEGPKKVLSQEQLAVLRERIKSARKVKTTAKSLTNSSEPTTNGG